MNMVSSVDGKAKMAGRASGIGSQEDRSVMRSLRSKVDAVMIGAGTLRAEKLSLGLDEEGRQPAGVVVSSRPEDLPLGNLVSLGKQRVIVLTGGRKPDTGDDLAEIIRVRKSGSGRVDLDSALGVLALEHGVETLLVEGGPSLNASLVSLGLVDELFLTVAPKLLAGDPEPPVTIAEGIAAGDSSTELRLVSVFAADDELFLRYALKPVR